jgi:hypothetical protein
MPEILIEPRLRTIGGRWKNQRPTNVSITKRHRAIIRITAVAIISGAGLLFVAIHHGRVTTNSPNSTIGTTTNVYPTGTEDERDPSGLAPPRADALAGFTQKYVTHFPGSALPVGWDAFSGVPSGVSDGQFGSAHSVVSGGLLRLTTSRDLSDHDRWVTGGVCQCGFPQTYGAYFVRSRLTGPGPNEVELLWPAANVWPPEIDFNESGRGVTDSVATVHFGTADNIDQRKLTVDLGRWHTWGVVWTRNSITYTVDGHAWGAVTLPDEIPDQPMTLHLQQVASCTIGLQYACPHAPVSMEIDWVAEYAQISGRPSATGGARPHTRRTHR